MLETGLEGAALWLLPVDAASRLYQYLYTSASMHWSSTVTLSPSFRLLSECYLPVRLCHPRSSSLAFSGLPKSEGTDCSIINVYNGELRQKEVGLYSCVNVYRMLEGLNDITMKWCSHSV